MRDYAKVGPQFWSGRTGRALKKEGPEAVIVAMYLMTCQHATMLGLYYLNPSYITADTGLTMEGAMKGLRSACEVGFCRFDEDSMVVWVVEMARYQIAGQLEAKDNRCKGIQREYDGLPENPYLTPFFEKYGAAFHMTSKRSSDRPEVSPFQAPSKPLRSQEQEQEQEQDKNSSAAAALHPLARDPADDLPPPLALEDKPPSEQAMAIAVWLRQREKDRGKPPRGAQGNDPRIVRWVQAGITGLQLAEAYCLAVADRDANGDPGTVTAGFLDVFVDRVLNPPAAASRLDGKPRAAARAADPLAWVTSASGISEQGAKLGLAQGDGEPFWQFKDRVIDRAGLTDGDKARLRTDYGVNL
ncbi:hypothetical protein [Achromobacter insuavis]|uniref:hypothetical protein n=1 Tax=Achromobacter insuavis TaxID=1287735 RepID=UPI001F131432|nr:hypothetical protein [Achromobacter insuavis]